MSRGMAMMFSIRDVRERTRVMGLLFPVTLFLGLFFLAPQFIMFVYSFLEAGIYGGVKWFFDPSHYARVFGFDEAGIGDGGFDPIYLSILLRSVKLAIITVALCLLLGYPAAFWISRQPRRRRALFLFLVTLPFFANALIRIYAWVLILRPTGFINNLLMGAGIVNEPLDLMYNEGTITVGLLYAYLPFMVLPLYASIEKLDQSLLEASYDLGARRFRTFTRIVLPLTAPGIIGGSILVFIPCVGNFIVPTLLGGAKTAMVGSLIEQQFLYARNWPFGAALTFILLALVMISLFVYIRLEGKHERRDRGVIPEVAG